MVLLPEMTDLVLDFSSDPLQRFLLSFGERQLDWDGITLSDQSTFFFLS